MQKTKMAHRIHTRFNTLIRTVARLGSTPRRRWLALSAIFVALTSPAPTWAQNSSSQLSIGTNTTLNSVDDGITSIVFTNASALTLVEGQTIRSVLVSKEAGAALNLGDGQKQGQTWTLVANSPSWGGKINVQSGNGLVVANGVQNPAGAYSESTTGEYGLVNLLNGASFKIPAREIGANGLPMKGETKIGALSTDAKNNSLYLDDATVDVGAEQTLTVVDGLKVDQSAGLKKVGGGELQFVVNGTTQTITNSEGGRDAVDSVTNFNFGDTHIAAGKLSLKSGSMNIGKAKIDVSSFKVGEGAELDIQYAGKIEIAGDAGDVVLSARDGSKIDLYVDAEGSTSYVATTYNTYMELGKVTLNVNSSVKGAALPKSMTVFSTADVGQTNYVVDDITVVDNLLGKNYVVDRVNSTHDSLVLSLEKGKSFESVGKTPNEKSVGSYLDELVASNRYNDKEYRFLDHLEKNIDRLNLGGLSGELHASTMGFAYMNNFTTQQTLFNLLRNNTLVAYSGASSSVAPMNYGEGNYNNRPGYVGGASAGAFDNGQLYYNNDTNSYGPGVVPIYNNQNQPVYNYTGASYNGETYGGGVGGMSGGSYNAEFEQYGGGVGNGYNNYYDGGYNGGYNNYGGGYSGGYGTGYSALDYNFGAGGATSASTLATYRAQEGATYGDPGTLIYSAWLAALGSAQEVEIHKDSHAYNGKQGGFLFGLDLFCSCDCRFGAYYGYQRNTMKNLELLGELKMDGHAVGVYHQWGDESIYTIASLRGGYDRYRTTREIEVLDQKDILTAKYNGWNAGASLERGANFAARPFIFTPYVGLDYNFFYRNKFTEESTTNSGYALFADKTNYHSLRSQVGARVALDMYPGDQQIRVVANAAYIHEFLNPTYGKTTLGFVDLPNASGGFDVYGNSMGRDWAVVGLGLDWTPIPALALFGKTDYLFNKYARNTYSSAGLKYRW